jgi:hypothetical protein
MSDSIRKNEIAILLTSLGPMGQSWTRDEAAQSTVKRLLGIAQSLGGENTTFLVEVLAEIVTQSGIDFRGLSSLMEAKRQDIARAQLHDWQSWAYNNWQQVCDA